MCADTTGPPRRLLQQFARFPEQGQVKTRLMRELSAEQACAVHEELLLLTAMALSRADLGECELWLDKLEGHSCVEEIMKLGFLSPRLQAPGDLGEKMLMALLDGLARADQVVLVGSDCPGLDPAYLSAAFARLDECDLVLGPATDGGFVLIGGRNVHVAMFRDVDWGTDSVLSQTLKSIEDSGLSVALLPERYDIDVPEDLRRWKAAGL